MTGCGYLPKHPAPGRADGGSVEGAGSLLPVQPTCSEPRELTGKASAGGPGVREKHQHSGGEQALSTGHGQADRHRAVLKTCAGPGRHEDHGPSHERAQMAAVSLRPPSQVNAKTAPREQTPSAADVLERKGPGHRATALAPVLGPESPSRALHWSSSLGCEASRQEAPHQESMAARLPCPRTHSFRCTGQKPPSQTPLNQRGAQPPSVHVHQDPASPRGNLSGSQPILTGPRAPRPPRAQRPPAPSVESSAQTGSAGLTHASTDPGSDQVPTRPPSAEQGAP